MSLHQFVNYLSEFIRNISNLIDLLIGTHMHDQRIKARALLCGKNLSDRIRIHSIGAQAINRLCGQGNNLAFLQ